MEFLGEHLKEEPIGHLFCSACRTDLDYSKKSTVQNHVSSKHHKEAVLGLLSREARNASIYKYVQEVQLASVGHHGSTLSKAKQVGRMELARALMMSGVKFSVLDNDISDLANIMESAIGQFHVSALRKQIPDIRAMEKELLKKELSDPDTPPGHHLQRPHRVSRRT